MGTADASVRHAGLLQRRLVVSSRLRTLQHEGALYAHASQVPLSYLAASPALMALLQRFAQAGALTERTEGLPSVADLDFFAVLLRAGVLLDADAPDPIHASTPDRTRAESLLLYPTSACNLRCSYCHATSGPGAGPSMGVSKALAAVDHFFATLDERVRKVVLRFHGGGEPTHNFPVMIAAWERFAALAAQRQLRCVAHTITNGVFGSEVLRVLQQPPWQVTVSFDGVRQAAQRPTAGGRDSRATVVANLQALRDSGKTLTTRATLTRDGLPQLRALVDDASALGIAKVQVEPASTVGRGAHLSDGPPDPREFAQAFVDAFDHALRCGVELTTSAWSHTRVGDGRYCGAIAGTRALTPDGYWSACTEVGDGRDPSDPFLVGVSTPGQVMTLWPAREARLQRRVGYELPHCAQCFMVDTCGGGCASRARAQGGDLEQRDQAHCTVARAINPRLIADLATGRLLPDAGWQAFGAELPPQRSALAGVSGRLVALVPPFARARWNADPERRPFFPTDPRAPCFFHLPPQRAG